MFFGSKLQIQYEKHSVPNIHQNPWLFRFPIFTDAFKMMKWKIALFFGVSSFGRPDSDRFCQPIPDAELAGIDRTAPVGEHVWRLDRVP